MNALRFAVKDLEEQAFQCLTNSFFLLSDSDKLGALDAKTIDKAVRGE